MPTIVNSGMIAFFLLLTSLPSSAFTLQDLQKRFSTMQQEAMKARLIPMPLARPVNCPVASVAFADIAEQMSDLALSLTDSKCYEKHAKTIAELARLNGDINSEIAKDMAAPENGALIDHNPQQIINITNTQIQNVKNQNSLINGFFDLAKDKTCVDSFRRRSRLSSVAGTLAKIGTLSLFLPSQVGLTGSAVSFLLGGSLLALDKLLQPKFTWKQHKDRRDFMAMTCAFYHLRSNLFYAGFFDVPTPQDPQRLQQAESLERSLADLHNLGTSVLKQWGQQWDERLVTFVQSKHQQGKAKMCHLIKEARSMLASPLAPGVSVDERLTLQSYFSKQLPVLTSSLGELPPPQPEVTKALAIISALDKLTHEEILTLSRRSWQLAYMQSLLFHLEAINKEHCGEIDTAVNTFNERHDFDMSKNNSIYNEQTIMAHHTLLSRINTLRHDISWSSASIKRLSQKKSLSSFDDGAMNHFDILLEYQNISKELLGKKGWSFVSYLLEQADKNIHAFMTDFTKWKAQKEKGASTQLLCRDSFVIDKFYDLADSAVEFCYDYLMATDELWSSLDKENRGFKRLLPFFTSNKQQLAMANEAAQLAKSVLEAKDDYSESELSMLNKQMKHTMGRVVIEVKSQEHNRQVLHDFSKTYCYAEAPTL